MPRKNIAILYHADCPDGFGGAYAAWKKFGDDAEYIPVKHGRPAPELGNGRDIYCIDFSYPAEIMKTLAQAAKHLIVLDHHEGARDVATAFPGIFDTEHSGATIAWSYFHPETPIPLFLRYVETGDLFRFDLPDSRAILSYAYTKPFHFDVWDELVRQIEDPVERAKVIARGAIYFEYYMFTVERLAARAELVMFEGYEIYLGNGASIFNSDVGHVLAAKKGPCALVTSVAHDGIKVSIRGDGSVDVSELARRHGGNGHPNASAFFVPWGEPLPWTSVARHHENPRD